MRLLTMVSFVTWAALANSRFGGGLVADLPVESEVVRRRPARPATPPLSIAVRQVGDGGQNIVVDLDRLGGVAGLLDGVGDDEGDGIADVAHGAVGQHRMRRRGLGGAVTVFDQRGAGQRTDALGRSGRTAV